MRNLFEKKQYLDCRSLKNSLHFFYDEVRACCSNVSGPIFYPDYNGEDIDWEYVFKTRKKLVNNINSFLGDSVPDCCKNCFEIHTHLSDKKILSFENKINMLYIQNNMSCNAKCLYCSFANEKRGYRYNVLPHVKTLIEKEILSPNAFVFMSGGETTISPEFDDLLDLFLSYKNVKVELLTSGIKYSEKIKNGFIKEKVSMVVSLDSGCRETYLRIKQVDAFDVLLSNLKEYTSCSDYAKENITLKYILVDRINDNKTEIDKFFNIVNELGIKKVRLDVDFVLYNLSNKFKVPEIYSELFDYFVQKSNDLNLHILEYDQIKQILNK